MASFDDNDMKLSVDETKLDCPGSSVLPFAAVMSSSRFSFAQSLTFLNASAPCQKVSEASVKANDLSWVMRYSIEFVGLSDAVRWVVYMMRRPL